MMSTLDKGGQYYPTDTTGVIDEWAALAMQNDNYWAQHGEQEKVNKRLRQKQYFDDLDNQRSLNRTDNFIYVFREWPL